MPAVDIYDGDEEPIIYHGKTWTSKVSLRDVCLAIAKYAFVASPYPIIISAEVHCGLAQQDIMVDIMTKVFGDALIRAPVEGRPKIETLPSPEALKGKFLLKVRIYLVNSTYITECCSQAKNLYVAAQLDSIRAHKAAATAAAAKATHLEADPSSSSSSDTNSGVMGELKEIKSKWQKARGHHAAGAKLSNPKVKMSFALASLLVYTVGVKCRGVNKAQKYAPEHVFSLSENTANKLLKASMGELIRHTQGHVIRIYPKGLRVNSTNYEPHRYWAAGAQVVAINWQTFGELN
jgi:phosphatidylinositol phospholipase C delta